MKHSGIGASVDDNENENAYGNGNGNGFPSSFGSGNGSSLGSKLLYCLSFSNILHCLKSMVSVNKNASTVLLVFFLYKMGEALLEPTVKLYLYEQTCLKEVTNDPVLCRTLGENEALERMTQQTASGYLMWYRILLNVPAIFLSLFSGAWSDKFGRKLPMIMPCIGAMLCVFFYLFSMMRHVPTFTFVLIGAVVNGFTGKSTLITMACHSYITDISTAEARTNLLGKLLSMNFLGIFLGSLLDGILLDVSDYTGTFLAVIFINGAALLVVVVMLPETIVAEEQQDLREKFLLCKCEHVKDSVAVAVRRRPNWKRVYLWLFFISIFIHQACKVGEVDVTLLFVKRKPLEWSLSEYGYYLSFDYAVLGLTLFFILPFLTDVLKMSDVNLLLLSIVTKIARLICIAAATQTWVVYVSSVVGCTGGILVSASKSLITKTIEEFEIGKTFSLLSCAETASTMIGAIVFTSVYRATADVFSGTAFLLDAIVYGFAMAVMLGYKRHSSQQLLEQQYAEDHPLQATNPFRNGTAKNGDDFNSTVAYDSSGQLQYEPAANGADDSDRYHLSSQTVSNEYEGEAGYGMIDSNNGANYSNPFNQKRNIDK